jgi:cytidylate kinase
MGLLIGITGLAQSGKDTFAEMLAKELDRQTSCLFVLMAYAHELKLRVQKDFDLSYEQLWGTEKEIEDKRYKKPFGYHGGVRSDRDELPGLYWTPREIMQNYGQFYRTIDYSFWVKHLFGVIKQNDYKNVIITDIRYPNEAKPIVDSDGYIIKITRGNKAEIHNQYHSSEISMDKYDKIDFVVGNNDTLDELRHNAVDVVKQIVDAENNKIINKN